MPRSSNTARIPRQVATRHCVWQQDSKSAAGTGAPSVSEYSEDEDQIAVTRLTERLTAALHGQEAAEQNLTDLSAQLQAALLAKHEAEAKLVLQQDKPGAAEPVNHVDQGLEQPVEPLELSELRGKLAAAEQAQQRCEEQLEETAGKLAASKQAQEAAEGQVVELRKLQEAAEKRLREYYEVSSLLDRWRCISLATPACCCCCCCGGGCLWCQQLLD
jgi:uncharacterized protein involved in exopolysaccharide biosynthesis